MFETGGKRERRVDMTAGSVRCSELEQQLQRQHTARRVSLAFWMAAGAARTRELGRPSCRTIQENLFVGASVVHAMGITAALLGWIGPIEAAVLQLGPDVLVFLNSVKLLPMRVEGAS